jgi:hypothetical protein
MTDTMHARLVNSEGELLAEGDCWLDERNAQATLEPSRALGFARTERGETLTLELDSGRTLKVSDRLMVVRISQPGSANGAARRSLYRMRFIGRAPYGATEDAQDAKAAGAAEEGTPAPREIEGLRFNGETSAAR